MPLKFTSTPLALVLSARLIDECTSSTHIEDGVCSICASKDGDSRGDAPEHRRQQSVKRTHSYSYKGRTFVLCSPCKAGFTHHVNWSVGREHLWAADDGNLNNLPPLVVELWLAKTLIRKSKEQR